MEFIKNYKVYISGEQIALEKARVSRFPFNRHWPGYQRSLDQTEVTAFASFDISGETDVTVECEFDFSEVMIRPLSLGIVPEIKGKTVSFKLSKPCQTVVEFDGISGALHLFADPIKQYGLSEDNVLYFGAGEHDVGRIELKSGQTVFIDKGAVVYGEIYGTDVENVKIMGKGILDHSKAQFGEIEDGFIDPPRPSPIVIEYSKNIEIQDIIVRDPCFLAVRPICCEDVHIDNIKILGNWRYNSDGIDLINCRRALIENCFVRSFDDSFCIKGFAAPYMGGIDHNGKLYDIAEDIIFRNCVAFNEWGKAFEVGIDLCATEIRNCRFENCDVIHSVDVSLDVANADYAYVHNIVFDDIRVEYSADTPRPVYQESDDAEYTGFNTDYVPPLLRATIEYVEIYSSKGERGKISDITFSNIRVTAPRMPESKFFGFDNEHRVSNIRIKDLYLNGRKIENTESANFILNEYVDNISVE